MRDDDHKHHSTDQPRTGAGQWRQSAGPFDHAGKVPAGPPRYGEDVPSTPAGRIFPLDTSQ